MSDDKVSLVLRFKGGPGSGFHGHAGRPGKVGGSSDDKRSVNLPVRVLTTIERRQREAEDWATFAGKLTATDKLDIERSMRHVINNSHIAIQIGGNALESLFWPEGDGRYNNAAEIGFTGAESSYTSKYKKDRNTAEKNMFGRAATNSDKPIYGYAIDDKFDPSNSAASAYGNITLVLDDDIKKESTVTYYDSMDAYVGAQKGLFGTDADPYAARSYPSPANDPSYVSAVDPITRDFGGKAVNLDPPSKRKGYIEFQIHRKIYRDNIRKIYIQRTGKRMLWSKMDKFLASMKTNYPDIEIEFFD